MFLNMLIYLLISKAYDGQFTLTTKKSLHIIFNGRQAAKLKEMAYLLKVAVLAVNHTKLVT